VTDADFLAWLASDLEVRCLLVEATYSASGVSATEYMATLPFTSLPTDTSANQAYAAIVKTVPQFAQAMSDALTGQTTANRGTVEVFAGSAATDAWIFDRDWIGYPITLAIGGQDWPRADFRALWSGVIGDVRLQSTNTIAFEIRDRQHLLNQAATVTLIPSGPNAGRPRPMSFGYCRNIAPALLDDSSHTYAVHDGPVQAVDAVYEDALALTLTTDYTVDTASGAFSLVAEPTGQITADVRGAVVDGVYLETAAQLLQHFATQRGALAPGDVDAAAFATLATTCAQPLGLFVPPAPVQVYQLMDHVASSVGAFYAITRDGLLFAAQLSLSGAPVLTIQDTDIVERGLMLSRTYAPVREISLGAVRNWTVQTRAAATVTEARRETIAREGLYATRENTAAGDYIKPADRAPRMTLLQGWAEADAEAARLLTIWGVPRYRFVAECFNASFTLQLGDTVRLVHPRYGLAAGRNGVVIGLKEKPSRKRTTLDILL
jgi:hypothetical protein